MDQNITEIILKKMGSSAKLTLKNVKMVLVIMIFMVDMMKTHSAILILMQKSAREVMLQQFINSSMFMMMMY